MSLKTIATIEIPGSAGQLLRPWRLRSGDPPGFCGAYRPRHRRGHRPRRRQTRRNVGEFSRSGGCCRRRRDDSVTNRGAASLAWLDARSLETRRVFKIGPRPNGVAIVARQKLAIAACIEDKSHRPTLHVVGLDDARYSIELPGRPRWCVTDAAGSRIFLAIQELLIQSINPRTGAKTETMTGAGAHTTALVPPDRLYVFSPAHGGAIVLADS